jgi:hypothetical protein
MANKIQRFNEYASNNIDEFEEWVTTPNKDGVVVPELEPKDLNRFIFHSSNVEPSIIFSQGIIPKSAKESKGWSHINYPAAVFAVNNYCNFWGYSNYCYVIDTTKLTNRWWYDKNLYAKRRIMYDDQLSAIVTDEKIPPSAIIGLFAARDQMNLSDIAREMFRENNGKLDNEKLEEHILKTVKENKEEFNNDLSAKNDYLRKIGK